MQSEMEMFAKRTLYCWRVGSVARQRYRCSRGQRTLVELSKKIIFDLSNTSYLVSIALVKFRAPLARERRGSSFES